jgi:hypothetical protein
MNKNLCTKVAMAVVILTLYTSTVLAQDQPKGPPPFPPPAQLVAHDNYLYVVNSHSIYQYLLDDNMTLDQVVTLPKPQPPTATGTQNLRPPMPPPPGKVSVMVEGEVLYVLDGRSIYRYQLPGLSLKQTVTLPGPDLSK